MSMDGEQARARRQEQRAEAQRRLGRADAVGQAGREAVDDDRLEAGPAAELTVEDAARDSIRDPGPGR
jgi:hypothetical protein